MKAQAKSNGQALIVGMALLAVSSVVLFLVFNSSRAVNEKINLVNAADAAAYSGAQIAARQLNFLAYTNRVMVANEVAIGHIVSYNAEIDVFSNAVDNLGGVVGNAIETLLNSALAYVGTDISDITSQMRSEAAAYTGSYIVGVSANNAAYSLMQKNEYESLASLNGKQSAISATMNAVASQYVNGPNVTIEMNSSDALQSMTDAGRVTLAKSAETNDEVLCRMVVFVKPTQASNSNSNGVGNALNGYCNSQQNGNGNPNGNGPKGTYDNPANDVGAMFKMLEDSASNVTSADWIKNRHQSEYQILNLPSGGALGSLLGFFGLNLDLFTTRDGSTDITMSGNSYNWVADNDEMSIYSKALLGLVHPIDMDGTASVDADSVAAATNAAVLKRAVLDSYDMCNDVDCDALPNEYQRIQAYPMLNPLLVNSNKAEVFITAVVMQKGTCNDTLGRKGNGAVLDGWNDDQTRFGQNCNETESLLAASRASVFYERPGCAGNSSCLGFQDNPSGADKPNLFNPFWQAKLDYADTRSD